MAEKFVIARGYGGKPLYRVVVSSAKGLIYLSSERAVKAVESGDIPAIGFPGEDVFAFDADAFAVPLAEWEGGQRTFKETWARLSLYQ